MASFENDDQLMSVAQSCRYFSSGGMANGANAAMHESISCRICKNSNGRKCVISAYDNVLTSMEREF